MDSARRSLQRLPSATSFVQTAIASVLINAVSLPQLFNDREYKMSVGLDDRQRDENGRIREKNGATKIGNLVDKYPDLAIFPSEMTLTEARTRYGVSLSGLIDLGRILRK